MITSPLRVQVTKQKWFVLNLNQYRNTHFHVLNKAKAVYKKMIADQLSGLVIITPIHITYTLYPKTKRMTDIGNVCSIHQKFFEDALTEFGLIEDDNYKFIPSTGYKFCEVDKHNPRVEIEIRTKL